jgi:predicted aspartyl protease
MQQTKQPPLSFTLKSNTGILRVLITQVEIVVPGQSTSLKVNAIWDTGAMGSVITENVVKALGLKPTGIKRVSTANGEADQNTYTVHIGLPNRVLIQDITVTEVKGMDVITLGDFSITNHNGTTCMSFRFPSSHEIDFVKNPTYGITPIKQIAPGQNGSNYTPPKKKRKK